MATDGQFYWPSVGTFVAAYGQFFMAANRLLLTRTMKPSSVVGAEVQATLRCSEQHNPFSGYVQRTNQACGHGSGGLVVHIADASCCDPG